MDCIRWKLQDYHTFVFVHGNAYIVKKTSHLQKIKYFRQFCIVIAVNRVIGKEVDEGSIHMKVKPMCASSQLPLVSFSLIRSYAIIRKSFDIELNLSLFIHVLNR